MDNQEVGISVRPWRVSVVASGIHKTKDLLIFDANNKIVTSVACVRHHEQFSDEQCANAKFIVECVNRA